MLLLNAAAAFGQTHLTTWGGTASTSNGQFDQPNGIAIDASDFVYVVETKYAGARVQKLNSSGVYQSTFGMPDPDFNGTNGKFTTPMGVAVDSAGNVYVSDAGFTKVDKFNSAGTFVARILQAPSGPTRNVDGTVFNPRSHFTIDRTTNTIYFPDSGPSIAFYTNPANDEQANPDRVQKITNTGAFVLKWGGAGTGDGQFDVPMATAVDSSGNVYVTDAFNHRVQKFTSAGVFVTKWGSSGTGDGQFNQPWGIAVDASNNVYVVDSGNNRIQKFTSAGVFVTKWGSLGTGNGQFNFPKGIATDSAGNIYVTDFTNHRVQKFAPVAADSTKPTVASIVRQTPSTQPLTTATTAATFRVTYSEAVTGVVAANFQIENVNGGTVTGTIGTPSSVSSSVYDIPVTLTGGSGEFRLKVVN